MLPMDNEMGQYLDLIAQVNALKKVVVISNMNLPRMRNVHVEYIGADYAGNRSLQPVLEEHKHQTVFMFAEFKASVAVNGVFPNISKLIASYPNVKGVCFVPTTPLTHEMENDFKSLFVPSFFPEYKDIMVHMDYILLKNDKQTMMLEYCLLENKDMEELLWTPCNLPNYVWHEGVEVNKKKKKEPEKEDVDEFERLGKEFEEKKEEEVREKTAKEIAEEKKRAKAQAAKEKAEKEAVKYDLDLPGVHYIIKQIVTVNAVRQLEWVRRIDSVLSSKKKAFTENKKNLYLYDNVIKYILWEKDSDAFLTAPHKQFLSEQVYEAACLYFSRYLDNHMSMLEKLMKLRQPNQPFYFPMQYVHQSDLFFYIDLSTEFSVLHKLFNVPKSAEFNDFNIHYLTPHMLGKALTYAVDKKAEYINKRLVENVPRAVVFNPFIHDQMMRFTIKLNPFLDLLHKSVHHREHGNDIMRQDVVTIMDTVFDCEFLKENYVLLSDSNTVMDLVKKNYPKLRPLLPDYIKDDESIFNLVYHYGLHAYQNIYNMMKKRIPNPTPQEVDLYMEAIRKNYWYKIPTKSSELFPNQGLVSGLMVESFIEFSIACMDLQNVMLPPSDLVPLLIPFVFEHHCEDLKAPFNKSSEFMVVHPSPVNARWITPELVYHMYKENDIVMSMEMAREFHTILVNLLVIGKETPVYQKFINKFIHQMSNKKNILPMERIEKEAYHPPNKMNLVLVRQRMLREHDLTEAMEELIVSSTLEKMTMYVKQAVNDEERILFMNRINCLVAFYSRVPRTPLSLDYTVDKDVLKKYVKDTSVSSRKQQEEIYRLYQHRDLLVASDEDVKDIMRLLTQLKAEEEKKSANQIHLLLDSMEENNILSVRMCYSIMDQISVKRHITFSNEQYAFYEMMCEHIQWAIHIPHVASYLFGNDLSLVNLILAKRSSLNRSIVENSEIDIFLP